MVFSLIHFNNCTTSVTTTHSKIQNLSTINIPHYMTFHYRLYLPIWGFYTNGIIEYFFVTPFFHLLSIKCLGFIHASWPISRSFFFIAEGTVNTLVINHKNMLCKYSTFFHAPIYQCYQVVSSLELF